MYVAQSVPYKFPKILIPSIYVLEYVRQVEENDDIDFPNSRKKGRMTFPIATRGYATNDRIGTKDAI